MDIFTTVVILAIIVAGSISLVVCKALKSGGSVTITLPSITVEWGDK